jgi:hypothetical protein
MPSWFTANRIAALAAFLTGIASALAGIEGALPSTVANAVATGVGIIGAIVTCLHFMLGAQKFDALTVKPPASTITVKSAPAPAASTGGSFPPKVTTPTVT